MSDTQKGRMFQSLCQISFLIIRTWSVQRYKQITHIDNVEVQWGECAFIQSRYSIKLKENATWFFSCFNWNASICTGTLTHTHAHTFIVNPPNPVYVHKAHLKSNCFLADKLYTFCWTDMDFSILPHSMSDFLHTTSTLCNPTHLPNLGPHPPQGPPLSSPPLAWAEVGSCTENLWGRGGRCSPYAELKRGR